MCASTSAMCAENTDARMEIKMEGKREEGTETHRLSAKNGRDGGGRAKEWTTQSQLLADICCYYARE